MSNETKWDVLVNAVDALADAQASSDNNVGLGHQDADLFMVEYDAALPDDLPVIPQIVGDTIEEFKANHYRLEKIFTDALILNYDEQDAAARAWLLGVWRVDETGEIVKMNLNNRRVNNEDTSN